MDICSIECSPTRWINIGVPREKGGFDGSTFPPPGDFKYNDFRAFSGFLFCSLFYVLFPLWKNTYLFPTPADVHVFKIAVYLATLGYTFKKPFNATCPFLNNLTILYYQKDMCFVFTGQKKYCRHIYHWCLFKEKYFFSKFQNWLIQNMRLFEQEIIMAAKKSYIT